MSRHFLANSTVGERGTTPKGEVLRSLVRARVLLPRLMIMPLMAIRRIYWRLFRPHTKGARAIVLTRSGEVVLVKHRYDKLWYLPGGGVKWREEVENALARGEIS
jgi:hypothetical protein